MKVNALNDMIKNFFLIILENLAGVVLLGGLGVIVYSFYKIGAMYGNFSLGAVLVIVSLLIAKGKGGE